jgi:uncharacterized protein (DUF3084 family)
MFKSDGRTDSVDKEADGLRADLREQIKELRTELRAMTERCDQFASERNAAMLEAAALREKVRLLEQGNQHVAHD